jgi:hypothetical protein
MKKLIFCAVVALMHQAASAQGAYNANHQYTINDFMANSWHYYDYNRDHWNWTDNQMVIFQSEVQEKPVVEKMNTWTYYDYRQGNWNWTDHFTLVESKEFPCDKMRFSCNKQQRIDQGEYYKQNWTESDTVSDQTIYDTVQKILTGSYFSDAAKKITVISKNGVVMLTGHIKDREERTMLVSMIKHIKGVSRVMGNLQLDEIRLYECGSSINAWETDCYIY